MLAVCDRVLIAEHQVMRGLQLRRVQSRQIGDWWEGQPQLGRSQKATQESLERIRQQMPFRVREVHPDNDSGILNDLLWNYCRRRRIQMSRSRPYQKNDNAWVEQKNW